MPFFGRRRPTFGPRYHETEDEFDEWAEKVHRVTDPAALRHAGYEWFELLGKLDLYDYAGRALIGRRLKLIDECRDKLDREWSNMVYGNPTKPDPI